MKHLNIATLILASTVLFGCVTSRSVVDVQMPSSSPNGNGHTVSIAATDERVFEAKPRSADIPSLKNEEEIGDVAITQRAVGRKRNGFGKGLGDVLLPEGKTVAQLVAFSIAEGYRQAGYRVVEAGDASSDTPVVTVHVREFWSWFSPGAFTVAVNNKAHLILDVPGTPKPIELITKERDSMQLVTENDWKKITEQGLRAIANATAKELCTNGQCSSQK